MDFDELNQSFDLAKDNVDKIRAELFSLPIWQDYQTALLELEDFSRSIREYDTGFMNFDDTKSKLQAMEFSERRGHLLAVMPEAESKSSDYIVLIVRKGCPFIRHVQVLKEYFYAFNQDCDVIDSKFILGHGKTYPAAWTNAITNYNYHTNKTSKH